MPFRMYNSLMGLAKESLHSGDTQGDTPEGEEAESSRSIPGVSKGLEDRGPDTDPDVLNLVDKLRQIVSDLPKANVATLRYIIRHLRRSVIMPVLSNNSRDQTVLNCHSSLTLLMIYSSFLPGLQSWRRIIR